MFLCSKEDKKKEKNQRLAGRGNERKRRKKKKRASHCPLGAWLQRRREFRKKITKKIGTRPRKKLGGRESNSTEKA